MLKLPDDLVQRLEIREGDQIELHAVGAGCFEVAKKVGSRELLQRLRQYRGRLPANFHFDREANGRG